MKPTKFSNLSPEDVGVILELSQIIDIAAAERVTKAMTDRKFCVQTAQGEKLLLVVHTTEHYDWLEGDFRMCEYLAASGINVMRPVGIGTFREGTMAYQLYTWYDGEDLEEALTRMNHVEQFAAGKKTGVLLRKLHALSPFEEAETEPWGIRFKRRVQNAIQSYNDNPVKSQGADLLARYLQDNQDLLENRPQTFTHGDCNTGNLMFCKDGQIGVIDLGWGNNYNDPWWDFKEMTFPNILPAHFITGQIKGYFEGEPPSEFFRLLSYYIAFGALESLRDLSRTDYLEEVKIALNTFDDMRNPMPTWYLSQVTATHDDIPEIVNIYRSLIGTSGCTWGEDYPNKETAEDDINNGWLYALKKQGKIIGVVSIGGFGELSDLKWKPKNPCELARIGVRPELQKQGIGTLMLQHCFEIAKNQGFDGIRILVAKTNTSALAMYEKNGFERCGEVFKFDIDFYCYQSTFKD
jgi:aminoglycoside phosphotransferase (APT) family kinase protein/GNAT superfamily N-acetyltransferase